MSHIDYSGPSWKDYLQKHLNNLSQDEVWLVPCVSDFSFVQGVLSEDDYKLLKKNRLCLKNECKISVRRYSENSLSPNDVPVMFFPTKQEVAVVLCRIKQLCLNTSFLFSEHPVAIYNYFIGGPLSISLNELSFMKEIEKFPSFLHSFSNSDGKELRAVIVKYRDSVDKDKMVANCLKDKCPDIAFIDEYIKLLND